MRPPASRLSIVAVLVLLGVALALPGRAAAAAVVNGDFERGSLQGWHVKRFTEAGNWFAYEGTRPPLGEERSIGPVQAPPQGRFAAIADQANPETMILWQDLALEADQSHLLSLFAYYDSYEPIAVPAPDTLSVDDEVLLGQANQQFRIDLIRPDAPLDSLAPGDVLATVFATRPGAAPRMKPTRLNADLSAFAGQTVRLRIAVATHEEVMNAGVDAVALDGNRANRGNGGGGGGAGGGAGARARFSFGKARPNRKDGSVMLPVQVPNTGLLSATKKRVIKAVTVKAPTAKTMFLRLRPSAATLAKLERRGKLRIEVPVVLLPAHEPRETATATVVFRLARPPGP